MTDQITFLPCKCQWFTHSDDGQRIPDWELNFLHDKDHADA